MRVGMFADRPEVSAERLQTYSRHEGVDPGHYSFSVAIHSGTQHSPHASSRGTYTPFALAFSAVSLTSCVPHAGGVSEVAKR